MAPHANTAGPAGGPGQDPLDRLMAERGTHLLHAAIALTGSRAEAEDLLQAAVERLLRSRRPVDDLEAYLRRILYNLAADGWRRRGRWLRVRTQVPTLSEVTMTDPVTAVDLRDALVRALRELTPRQRTVVILRYWEQLTQAETAELLGCSQGNVKAMTSRGLSRLRELTATWHDPQPGPAKDAATTKGTP
jgi:RNA polymerase sigma-70 factor (sigma-E family)